jgi:uracil-DNA glycosylase family 4
MAVGKRESNRARAADADDPIAAWVEYFRDLGVHDFYRWGEWPATPVHVGAAEHRAAPGVAADPEHDAAVGANVEMPTGRAGVEAARADLAPEAGPEVAATIDVPIEAALGRVATSASGLVPLDQIAPPPGARIPAGDRASALAAIQAEIGDCTRCPLAYGGRRNIVFGDGSPNARLMFVGEGPGADEDAQGVPFVGKAGQLLNNMIAAMGLKREEVYIANIVKCRPPANRVPEPVEANTCSPFLLAQIDVVRPEVIVALGATAATYLLGVKQALAGLRGRWHRVRDAKVVVTYHPAFLLRDPRMKGEAWKDLQMVMAELGLRPRAKS